LPEKSQPSRAPASTGVQIRGPRLLLRPLWPAEIDAEWQAMVTADPMTIAELPDEAMFRARLGRSGQLVDGWLDLAIDFGGTSIGRIQTFVPPGRPLPPGTFEAGIALREEARGQGYGREALALLTGWLFEHAGAQAVEARRIRATWPCGRYSSGSAGPSLARSPSMTGSGSCTGSPGSNGRRGQPASASPADGRRSR
jgi:GNAT superfamily N-acetyltransferase